MFPKKADLTVAVTGPTGTFGFGLMPLLQVDPRITKIVGIARRPFDPAEHGWDKMEYRQGDVRDPEALKEAFEGAEVVVHLAFMITGNAPRDTIRAINVDGTLNVFRAAAAAGAQRFAYASSVAAYGWFADNPVGMTEEHPVRPANRLFYGQEKAELEELLEKEAEESPEIGLYLLRPPIVLGPHAVGGKDIPLGSLGGRFLKLIRNANLPLPTLAPKLPVQFIHEDDVGQAFIQCITAEGPPGAYNITGDGVMTGDEVARELGLTPIALPAKPAHLAARALAKVPMPPFVPPATEWVEPLSHPSIMDASKAKEELGWEPKYSSVEALRETLASL